MTKTLLLAVFGLTALIVNPFFGCETPQVAFQYGAPEMRAAIEGTWKLHVAGKRDLTLTIKQAAKAEQQHAMRATLVRSANACASRSFVRSAGACLDVSEMPLDVEVAGMSMKSRPKGDLMVIGVEFREAFLQIELDDLEVTAHVSPTGTVEEAKVSTDLASRPANLVRVR